MEFHGISRNSMKFHDFSDLEAFMRFMWSGWSRAPRKHQYSYRNIEVFSMGPPGTLQITKKLIYTRILLQSPKFSIISRKSWNFVNFHGILVISRFWGSHGAGPSIWPRKNKRFVKGRGFVKNVDFLIFHEISWNFMISIKPWNFMKFQEFHKFPRKRRLCAGM